MTYPATRTRPHRIHAQTLRHAVVTFQRPAYGGPMVSKGRHPKQPIADALDTAKEDGLTTTEIHKGHRWGTLTCPTCGEKFAIYSTPKDPDNHANQIRRWATRHQHAS